MLKTPGGVPEALDHSAAVAAAGGSLGLSYNALNGPFPDWLFINGTKGAVALQVDADCRGNNTFPPVISALVYFPSSGHHRHLCMQTSGAPGVGLSDALGLSTCAALPLSL